PLPGSRRAPKKMTPIDVDGGDDDERRSSWPGEVRSAQAIEVLGERGVGLQDWVWIPRQIVRLHVREVPGDNVHRSAPRSHEIEPPLRQPLRVEEQVPLPHELALRFGKPGERANVVEP